MNEKILIVDDDLNICKLLELYLQNEGYLTSCAHDGSAALDAFRTFKPDMLLLDIMLPFISGWEVCKMIRRDSMVPIIMLSSKDMIEDKIQGFEYGADDYILKPFEPREVMIRIKARLRYKSQGSEAGESNPVKSESFLNSKGIITLGELYLDINSYDIKLGGEPIELKPKEIQLLHFLLTNNNIVFSRDQLLEKVWGYDYAGDTRTVDVHIMRLREKLEKAGTSWTIKTIWGVGYKLEIK